MHFSSHDAKPCNEKQLFLPYFFELAYSNNPLQFAFLGAADRVANWLYEEELLP